MQTILDILHKAGGWHPGLALTILNPPHMQLVIEAIDESGPLGLPALSVAQYEEYNGDFMRTPEMYFELGLAGKPHLDPFFWRNDWHAQEQWSRRIVEGHYVHRVRSHQQLERFAAEWEHDLRLEGFVETFDPNRHRRS